MTVLLSVLLCTSICWWQSLSFSSCCISLILYFYFTRTVYRFLRFETEWEKTKFETWCTTARILSLKLSSTILCALGNIAFYIAIQFNVHLIVITTFSFFFVLCSRMHGSWIWLQHFWKLEREIFFRKHTVPKVHRHMKPIYNEKTKCVAHLFRCWTISIGLWYKKCNQWNRKSTIQTSKHGFTKFGYQSITITNASSITISIGVDKSTLCHSCRTKSTRSTSLER